MSHGKLQKKRENTCYEHHLLIRRKCVNILGDRWEGIYVENMWKKGNSEAVVK